MIADLKEDIEELEEELQEATDQITMKWANLLDDTSVEQIKPRRTDVTIALVTLAWLPSWSIVYQSGRRRRTAIIAAYRLPR